MTDKFDDLDNDFVAWANNLDVDAYNPNTCSVDSGCDSCGS